VFAQSTHLLVLVIGADAIPVFFLIEEELLCNVQSCSEIVVHGGYIFLYSN